MKQYIGTKLIEAEPCPAWKDMGEHKAGEPGYKVRYADGYESWSPKDVFEQSYLPVQINSEAFTETMGDKCTVVRADLRNGFEIVGVLRLRQRREL